MAFSKGDYTVVKELNEAHSDLVGLSSADIKQIAEQEQDNGTEVGFMTMLARAHEPTPWAFEGFIVEGDQIMVAGAPKAGKTWLSLQLALAAAAGGRFLRWSAVRPLKTLYINMEVGAHMWAKRVKMMAGDNPMSYRNFYSTEDVRSFDVLDVDQRKEMADRIKRGGYEFVVIDVLSRCHFSDENDNSTMKQVLLALRVMCGDATHVVVHHSRKPPAGAENVNLGAASIRGASAIVGEVDLAMTLTVRAGQGARYSLMFAARNVEEPDEMLLDRSEDDMLYFEFEGTDNNLDDVIAHAFRTESEIHVNDLRQLVSDGCGVTVATARNLIYEATAKGLIERKKVGRRVYYTAGENAPFLRVAPMSAVSTYQAMTNGDPRDCPF